MEKKKCLGCENLIDQVDHYVCRDCYEKVKNIKSGYISTSNFELKNEYERWKRNMLLARDQKYRNEYQLKVIAIAELLKEKYKDSKALISIIDYSNNQKTKNPTSIKINEKELEDSFENENKDENIDLSKYESRHKCKDGHRTISKSEEKIDDFLTDSGIRHAYDREIDDNTNFRYDFKLLDYNNVYIEHWGFKNRKNYEERKRIKTQYYLDNGYTLINSNEDTITDINHLKNELRAKIPDIFKK